jgi:hypothetical protein
VQLHADDTKRWQECSLKEQINIKVDSLARKALMAAHSTGKCIKSAFPYEQIWISMGGEKVMGSMRSKLEEFWGRSTAKKFFHEKGIISSTHFDSVWWLGYKRAISKYQKLSAHSSQNRYLVGATATPSSHFGKRYHQQMPAVRMQ